MRIHLTRRRSPLVGVALVATLAGLGFVAPGAQAEAVVRDGTTALRAAASCYEIKQVTPSAPSGKYWLQTPALIAPQQFYCDQTTSGGGWVLIGRGRENWGFMQAGQGTADSVAGTPDGTAAFVPAALPATTIDGLLNGGRVDALADGVRLRRAKTVDGATNQEVRFKFTSRDRWNWTMAALHPIASWSMTGTGTFGTTTASGTNATSNSFGSDQVWSRVGTLGNKAETYKSGFAYGTSATVGNTTATSYVWKTATSGARSVPFTQVYLRPTLTSANSSYPAINDYGTEAQALRSLPETTVQVNPWGVGGLANGNDGVDDTEVRAIAQVGDRMIVGGNFAYVQQDEAGTGRVNQQYLAAFDVSTGEWKSDFRPTFDGQVQRIIGLPNGDAVVAGDFTTVNGVSSPGLVVLDPTTGAIDTTFRLAVQQQVAASPLYVRGLDVRDGYLYIGGNFSHVSGGSNQTFYYSRSLARVSVTDGKVDTNWRPVVLGNINAIKASEDGTRVYVVGKYTSIQGNTTQPNFSVLSAASGAAVVPGLSPQFSTTKTTSQYQQAVTEAGSRVWEGGSEHMMFTYNKSDLALSTTNIAYNKGDFQILTAHDGVVYGSCHCSQWLLSGAKTKDSPTGWTEADNLQYIGAWDATTGKYLPEFVPEGISDRQEFGAWAITFDSNGTMWTGGDFVSGRGPAGTRVWTGAFQRFAPRDDVAPSTPTNARTVARPDNVLRLTWTLSTDNTTKPIRYEVIADDRVIANVGGNVADLPMPTSDTRYFVRAIDKAGNRSASTPVITYTL
jgi:trimeric autotransporter adhesin